MTNNILDFTVHLSGAVYAGIAQIDKSSNSVNATPNKTEKLVTVKK
ncbi:MAG: hypothetical protein WCU80_01790 [Paludibacteraceae bacterium]